MRKLREPVEASNPHMPVFDEPKDPPKTLYKYLHPDRIDVLRNGQVRFTPLLGTNDVFEVRRTFKNLIGPKFLRALQYEILSRNLDDQLVDKAAEHMGLDAAQNRDLILSMVRAKLGDDYQDIMKSQVLSMLDVMMPMVNSDETIERLLEDSASKTLAFSLSEAKNNSAMLAHYADQGRGFIVGFDTTSPIFKLTGKENRRPYFKISYFDELIDELIDDPLKAIASKSTAWANEQEWRIYAQIGEEDRLINAAGDEIHLFSFDSRQLSTVILGHNATIETEGVIKEILCQKYSSASIRRLRPKKFGDRFEEFEV